MQIAEQKKFVTAVVLALHALARHKFISRQILKLTQSFHLKSQHINKVTGFFKTETVPLTEIVAKIKPHQTDAQIILTSVYTA